MDHATNEKNLLRAAFTGAKEQTKRLPVPSWVERLCESAFERFAVLGFPSTDEEDWKYTNVAPIARRTFEIISSKIEASAVAPFIYEEAQRSRLVFANGAFRADLSSTENFPAGVVAAPMSEMFTGQYESILRQYLTGHAAETRDAFSELNTAFLVGSGAFIYIPKDVRVESPLHLLFLSEGGEKHPAINSPRVLVVTEPGSEATIIESYAASKTDAVYLTNAVVEIFIGDQARMTHYKVQDESEQAFHIATTNAQLGRSSRYDLTTITLGAQLSRHGINVKLDHEGAECWVDGLYLVGTGQHADTHSLIDHRKPHCTSHQNYKGILDGKSRAVFNGRVFVHKDAQKTDAMQSNKNLLLSNEARIDTKPQLEIFADDVKCAHGATVGQLEAEELFYLASRGLHPELARNLLTYGFAEEIVNKINIGSIKAQLDEAILHRLQARLEA